MASLEPEKTRPSAPDVPPENQETHEILNEPAPDLAPAHVPLAQVPIRSAIRPPTQPEQGRSVAADPLPDTLESLQNIRILKEVETFKLGVINLEGSASQGPPWELHSFLYREPRPLSPIRHEPSLMQFWLLRVRRPRLVDRVLIGRQTTE